jgi:hypothetical protein
MVQSSSDEFAASQRDHPGGEAHRTATAPPAAASPSNVAELTMLVMRLQEDLESLRTQLRAEVRTRSIDVEDGDRRVTILPGEITVERSATTGDHRSGSSVHIRSSARGAEVRVGAAFLSRHDPGVAAILEANWEGRFPGPWSAPSATASTDTVTSRSCGSRDRSADGS